jgi:hypothetical protein
MVFTWGNIGGAAPMTVVFIDLLELFLLLKSSTRIWLLPGDELFWKTGL